ncbi:MAG: hypothetical protein JRN06_01990 [Nitrososphaerota archaeon]|nr:hypothetical protein [Nitrososphaerota archaeon]MDG7023374.1 hypothetical protein [Nitrososphaerota archaeon]
MRADTGLVTSLAAGGAVGIPSLGAVAVWLDTPRLYPSTPLEAVVCAVILLRSAVFGFPRFRQISTGAAVVVLSGDVLVLPVAAIMYFLTGDPAFTSFAGGYLAAWLSAALLFYTPVAGLAVAEAMRRRSRLAGVVPAAAGAFVISSLVLTGVMSADSGRGLTTVARLSIGNLKEVAPQSPTVYFLLLVCAAALFFALGAYSVTIESSRGGRLTSELTVGVVGVAALLGWVQLTPGIPPWEAFGLPAAIIVGLAWVISRES